MVLTTFKAGDYKDNKNTFNKKWFNHLEFFYCQYGGILFFNNDNFIFI